MEKKTLGDTIRPGFVDRLRGIEAFRVVQPQSYGAF